MATHPIPDAVRDLPQPVLPELIRPRLDQLLALAETAQVMCATDRQPDGALTPIAARSLGHILAALRVELDAVCETMRLKITSLDCVQAIARELGREGMTEAALYRRLNRRGFHADDMRAAVLALIERGGLVRIPDADATGKRGPKPHRLFWRQTKEPNA